MPRYPDYVNAKTAQGSPIPDDHNFNAVNPTSGLVKKVPWSSLRAAFISLFNWDNITGNISDNEALQAELDAKAPADAVIPTGGTAGQALVKFSSVNYDCGWSDIIAVAAPEQTFTADGTISVPAGTIVISILILPSGNLTGLKLGTTDGGDEIISEQDIVANGKYKSFAINYKAVGSETWYLKGISGTVLVQQIKT